MTAAGAWRLAHFTLKDLWKISDCLGLNFLSKENVISNQHRWKRRQERVVSFSLFELVMRSSRRRRRDSFVMENTRHIMQTNEPYRPPASISPFFFDPFILILNWNVTHKHTRPAGLNSNLFTKANTAEEAGRTAGRTFTPRAVGQRESTPSYFWLARWREKVEFWIEQVNKSWPYSPRRLYIDGCVPHSTLFLLKKSTPGTGVRVVHSGFLLTRRFRHVCTKKWAWRAGDL